MLEDEVVAVDPTALPAVEYFEAGKPFAVRDIGVIPFTVPHDAVDPVGFVFTIEGIRIGMVTDLGYMPPNVSTQLRRCDVLYIESNHDLEMLRNGPYPWSVKQRVLSRVGHLSNDALADFFTSEYDGSAAFIVLAHLSESNNHPELAQDCAVRALGTRSNLLMNRILLAEQSKPMEPIFL
jgi:phosphoribosyl 1,2-cyclic phosphodiesterase